MLGSISLLETSQITVRRAGAGFMVPATTCLVTEQKELCHPWVPFPHQERSHQPPGDPLTVSGWVQWFRVLIMCRFCFPFPSLCTCLGFCCESAQMFYMKHLRVWCPFPTISHLLSPRTHVVSSVLRAADLAQVLSHLLLSPSTWTPWVCPTPGTSLLGLDSVSSLSLTSTAFPKHTPAVCLAVTCCPRAASTSWHFASLKGTFVSIRPSCWALLLEQ